MSREWFEKGWLRSVLAGTVIVCLDNTGRVCVREARRYVTEPEFKYLDANNIEGKVGMFSVNEDTKNDCSGSIRYFCQIERPPFERLEEDRKNDRISKAEKEIKNLEARIQKLKKEIRAY